MTKNKKINSRGWSPFFKTSTPTKMGRVKIGEFKVYIEVQDYENQL